MNIDEARAIFDSLRPSVLDVIEGCKPDYIGALEMFEKMMTVGTSESDCSLERIAGLYQGVKRMIPQNPKRIGALRADGGFKVTHINCPSCEVGVCESDRFCRRCGQALDWSDKE